MTDCAAIAAFKNHEKGKNMRIMALDFGEKNIGVALSDPLGVTAGGLLTLKRQSIKKDLQGIFDLVQQHDVGLVVMGLPLNMDGSRGPAVEKAEEFAKRLRGRLSVAVTLWDERLSTRAAERVLLEGDVSRRNRQNVIDKMAAVVILQGYLDSNKKTLDR
jgi:putative holliday junction resolvase